MGQKKKIKSIGCFLLALMVCVNISPPVHAEETRAETETGYIDYARGMTVYSESKVWPEFGDITYLASNVTDGNPDTRWAPKSTPCSLIIDLGTPRDIDRMVIRETAQYVGRIQGYEVSCSNELNGAYQVIADGGEAGTLCRVDFGNMINARFFKLEITASNNADGPNIDSVELYNTTDEPGPEEIEWQEFLNDTSWWNELDINGVGRSFPNR